MSMPVRRYGRNVQQNSPHTEEGPFVSFTDLLAGILFLFLILVASLLLRQQTDSEESSRMQALHSAGLQAQIVALQSSNAAQITGLQDENKELRSSIENMKSLQEKDDRPTLLGKIDDLNRRNETLSEKYQYLVNKIKSMESNGAEQEKIIKNIQEKYDDAVKQINQLNRDASDTGKTFRPAFIFNRFECELQNYSKGSRCPTHYYGTLEIYDSIDGKNFHFREINRAPGIAVVMSPSAELTREQVESARCDRSISRSEIVSSCRDYFMITTLRMRRVSSDLYAGTQEEVMGNNKKLWYEEYKIIKFEDDKFK